MSDETTLLPCPFCGGEAHVVSDYSSEHDETRWNLWHECCEHDGESAGYGHALFPWFETPWYKTEAEAIAAWNTRATHSALTAEQVREAVMSADRWEKPMGNTGMTNTHLIVRDDGWQAIADELNAKLGSGTCEVECFDDGVDEGLDGEWFSYAPPTWYLSCGHTAQGTERPNFCPRCGKRCVHHG